MRFYDSHHCKIVEVEEKKRGHVQNDSLWPESLKTRFEGSFEDAYTRQVEMPTQAR